MALKELLPFVQENGCVALDLRKPAVWHVVTEQYGGFECMCGELPSTAQAFADGRQAAPQQFDGTHDFQNGCAIGEVSYDPATGLVSVEGVTSLTDRADFIDQFLEVSVKGGDETSWCTTRRDTSVSWSCLPTEYCVNLSGGRQPSSLEILYTVVFSPSGEGAARAMTAKRTVRLGGVSSVAVKAPVKKSPGAQPPINICYNRAPANVEDVDYQYRESFDASTGKQWLWAPLSADVTLEGAAENPFYGIDMSTFALKMDSRAGFARYVTEGREDAVRSAFKATDQGFSFALPDEWKTDVPSSRLPARDRVDLYFSVDFQRQDGTVGTVDISSLQQNPGGGSASVGWLNLLWGCVGKGTMVLMADGTERPVERLTVGDVVQDRQGAVRVTNVVTGTEGHCWAVQTADGAVLRCSDGHPVLTADGMVAVDKLTGDMRLVGADGSPRQITGIWRDEQSGEVYNISTERGGADEFVANGIVVGGMGGQAGLARRRLRAAPARNPFELERKAWNRIMEGKTDGR